MENILIRELKRVIDELEKGNTIIDVLNDDEIKIADSKIACRLLDIDFDNKFHPLVILENIMTEENKKLYYEMLNKIPSIELNKENVLLIFDKFGINLIDLDVYSILPDELKKDESICYTGLDKKCIKKIDIDKSVFENFEESFFCGLLSSNYDYMSIVPEKYKYDICIVSNYINGLKFELEKIDKIEKDVREELLALGGVYPFDKEKCLKFKEDYIELSMKSKDEILNYLMINHLYDFGWFDEFSEQDTKYIKLFLSN